MYLSLVIWIVSNSPPRASSEGRKSSTPILENILSSQNNIGINLLITENWWEPKKWSQYLIKFSILNITTDQRTMTCSRLSAWSISSLVWTGVFLSTSSRKLQKFNNGNSSPYYCKVFVKSLIRPFGKIKFLKSSRRLGTFLFPRWSSGTIFQPVRRKGSNRSIS